MAASQSIADLVVDIRGNTAELRRDMKQATGSLDRMRSKAGQLQRAVTGVIAAMAVREVVQFADRTFRAAEEAERLAASLGTTTTQVQELTFAFSEHNLQQQDVGDALSTIADRAQDAADGMKSYQDDFGLVGLKVEELRNKRPAELFRTFAEAVADTEDPTRRTSAVVRILGDDLGQKLMPLLMQGGDGLDRMADKGRRLGRVFKEETNREMADAAEKFRDVKNTIGAEFTKAVADNADAFSTLATALAEIVKFGGKAVGIFTDLGKDIGRGTAMLVNGVNPIEEIQNKIKSLERQIENFQPESPDSVTFLEGVNPQLADLQVELGEARAEWNRLMGDMGGNDGGSAGEKQAEAAKKTADNHARAVRNITQEQALLHPIVDQMGDILTLQDAINADQQLMLDRALWEEMDKGAGKMADTLRMADGSVADLSLSFDEAKESGQSFNEEMKSAVAGWASDFSSELANAAVGADASFDQILQSFTKMLAQMVIQKQIVEPFLSEFGIGSGGGDGSSDGRAYGGPVSAGGMYEVNERGSPEMLTTSAGRSYLMMGSNGGRVTPSQGGASSSGGLIVNVHNYSGEEAQVSERRGPNMERMLDIQIGRSIRQGQGRKAIRETFDVQARTG